MYKIDIFKKRVKNINRSSGRLECCIGQGFDSRSNKNQATSLLHKCKSLQRNRYFLTYGWSTSTGVFEAWIFFRVFSAISLIAVHRKGYLFSSVYHSSTNLLWQERSLFVYRYTFDILIRYLFSVLKSQSLCHFWVVLTNFHSQLFWPTSFMPTSIYTSIVLSQLYDLECQNAKRFLIRHITLHVFRFTIWINFFTFSFISHCFNESNYIF